MIHEQTSALRFLLVHPRFAYLLTEQDLSAEDQWEQGQLRALAAVARQLAATIDDLLLDDDADDDSDGALVRHLWGEQSEARA